MANEYSFLDQFLNQTINLTDYLKKISLENGVTYNFQNIQPVVTTIKNLFYQVDVINDYSRNVLFFEQYLVEPGETIDYVSYQYYGDSTYWWVIAIFNNIKNPYTDWCFTDEQLNYLVDFLVKYENKYPKKTYYNLLFERNEELRQLKILKSSHLPDLIYSFIVKLSQSGYNV